LLEPVRETAAMTRLLAAFSLLLGGCTAAVTHPTKTLAEQRVDIDFCTAEANHKYWMDPIAALLHAYDCLEAKGYRRTNRHVSAQVESAVRGKDRPATRPAQPCRVPCGG
jgi:hypothetical protein